MSNDIVRVDVKGRMAAPLTLGCNTCIPLSPIPGAGLLALHSRGGALVIPETLSQWGVARGFAGGLTSRGMGL